MGIMSRCYIDDHVLFKHPRFAKLHFTYFKKLLGELGFQISSKPDGMVIGQQNVPSEVLGLFYTSNDDGWEVAMDQNRLKLLEQDINVFIEKLTSRKHTAKQLESIIG